MLCEKPLAINRAWAAAMIEAAVRNDVFLMEAYMYRCLPQTKLVAQLVRDGEIGNVHQIQASFAFQAGFRAESRIFADDLAGGGILDVGGYPVSYRPADRRRGDRAAVRRSGRGDRGRSGRRDRRRRVVRGDAVLRRRA